MQIIYSTVYHQNMNIKTKKREEKRRKMNCGGKCSSLNTRFISSCCLFGVEGQEFIEKESIRWTELAFQSRAMMSSSSSAAAPDWSERGRLVEVSPVSESGCFLLVPLVGAELDGAASSSSESTIMMSSSSAAAEDHKHPSVSQTFVYL